MLLAGPLGTPSFLSLTYFFPLFLSLFSFLPSILVSPPLDWKRVDCPWRVWEIPESNFQASEVSGVSWRPVSSQLA